MVKSKNVLASVATVGLLLANPALAAQSTRSSDALPGASAQVAALDFARPAAPLREANEANPRASLLLALFAVIGAVGLIIAASSGGGNDSPG